MAVLAEATALGAPDSPERLNRRVENNLLVVARARPTNRIIIFYVRARARHSYRKQLRCPPRIV